jgi:AraC-like DNA-binding protein
MLQSFLNLLDVKAQVTHNAKVCGSWTMSAQGSGLCSFHMITQGECLLVMPEVNPLKLEQGDLVFFSQEFKHQLTPLQPMKGKQQHVSYQCDTLIGTAIFCGQFEFGHIGYQQLLAVLPPYIVIKQIDSADWLPHLHALIVKESIRSGTKDSENSVVLNRLCELIFSYTLEHIVADNGVEHGLIALYASKSLSPALSAIHKHPAERWTLARLAHECAMSRTVFSQKFKAISGWSVMQYVIWWRMQLARSYLQNDYTISQVADLVGYQSKSAFNRAFNQVFGQSAGQVKSKKNRLLFSK